MSVRTIAVDYHNTLPLRAGLESMVKDGSMTLDLAHPAAATQKFKRGEYLLGLLPVAAKLTNPEADLVGNHGIVARGMVGSVGIFSELPLSEINVLMLDHDSRSSVLLARILMKHHWRLSPKLQKAQKGYRSKIGGRVAGVIIGDPAITARSQFKYYYDLGQAWYEMTGLPFVFAAWLSGLPLPASFTNRFDEAQDHGVAIREQLAKEFQPLVPNYNLEAYFTRQIHYNIDSDARRGLQLFLKLGRELLSELAVLDTRVKFPLLKTA